MASAQVLPSSRKQEHLEAGKRRLEEFRKKKAADRAKKAAANCQVHSSDVHANEKQPSNIELERPPVSDDAETSVVRTVSNERQLLDTELVRPPLSDSSETSILSTVSVNPSQTQGNKEKQSDLETSVKSYNGRPYKFSSDQSISLQTQPSQEISSSSSRSSFQGKEESLANESTGSLKEYSFANLGPSLSTVASISSNSSGSDLFPTNRSNASSLLSGQTNSYSNEGFASRLGGAVDPSKDVKMSKLENGTYSNIFTGGLASQMKDHPSTALLSGISDSPNHVSLYCATGEAQPRRSRPSFLDSLNVSRASPITSKSSEPVDSATSSILTSNSMNFIGSSAFKAQHPESEDLGPLSKLKVHDAPAALELSTNSLVSVNNNENFLRPDANGENIERKPDLFLQKQNEDFAALEQHIEDLTQEKFSLQRALEASRSLADSLAAENSSLTDNYNQQRGVVNQLKADMERLQEEINAQMAQLEFIKQEYTNAQLECSAADERAKLLASEVIGLEEKALRLRSNELKLERQLENSQEEISLCRKKLSSLEKERQDLESTISALQEEKKLLQSKLRKASAGGKPLDLSKSSTNLKDMSTSTEDLETSKEQVQSTGSIVGSGSSSSILQPDIEASSMYLPPDQIRTIENINMLIVELAMEKDELLKGLASATSENSKLKAFNEELSKKLEAQTQRLELLAAQSMTSESVPFKQLDSHAMHETTAYADEGDEVVERVLGWIMKLFPGGPSRRRTSKLL